MQSLSDSVQQLIPPPPQHIMVQQATLGIKLSDAPVLLKKNTAYLVSYDLSSSVDTLVPANDKAMIHTNNRVAKSDGMNCKIAPRSVLAAKHYLSF